MSGNGLLGALLVMDGASHNNFGEELLGFALMDAADRERERRRQQENQRLQQLRNLEKQIAWQQNQQAREAACRTLLARAQANIDETKAAAILTDLRTFVSQFEHNRLYANEIDVLTHNALNIEIAKYSHIVQVQADNLRQTKAHACIKQMHLLLAQGNIPEAYKKLIEARDITKQITNISNIKDQQAISLQEYVPALAQLQNEKLQYEERAKEAAITAELIVVNAIKGLTTTSGAPAMLYSVHAAILKEKIRIEFVQNWMKFDRRDVPEDLVGRLTEIIASKRKDIGNKKWAWDLCRPNSSIDKIELRLHEIAAAFAIYSPDIPAPTITIDIGESIPVAVIADSSMENEKSTVGLFNRRW